MVRDVGGISCAQKKDQQVDVADIFVVRDGRTVLKYRMLLRVGGLRRRTEDRVEKAEGGTLGARGYWNKQSAAKGMS